MTTCVHLWQNIFVYEVISALKYVAYRHFIGQIPEIEYRETREISDDFYSGKNF